MSDQSAGAASALTDGAVSFSQPVFVATLPEHAVQPAEVASLASHRQIKVPRIPCWFNSAAPCLSKRASTDVT